MSGHIELLENDLRSSICRTRWLLTAAFLLISVGFVAALYSITVASAVEIWWTRDTYGYAFAVIPIAVYLVWMRREYFRSSVPEPTLLAIPLVILFAGLWATGQRFDILELEHLAFVGIVVSIILSVIGWRSALHFALPLAYMFLLAPSGSPILPYLQDVATVLSTLFLQVGQIPFFAEGYLIEVSTGKYEVAPGCAGLNFVLAMATVAPLYCEIMFTDWTKKIVALTLLVLLVPIANGLRIFGIIAIAEYTNLAIDISADHLFYGWVFFSVIVLVMFWVGSFFADRPPSPIPSMPWGGHYTLAELLADPIMIRLRIILIFGVILGVLPAVIDISRFF